MGFVSKAQICNLALAHIYQTGTLIANLDTDSGNTAVQCRLHYDVARKFVIADHDWNFATRRVGLADIGSPPSEWSYRYDYPSDALKIQEIQRLSKTDTEIPFSVEAEDDGSGLSILTDMVDAVGVYTWDVEATELFPPGFVVNLSWFLASELAAAMTGDRELQQATLTVYRNIGGSAEAVDSAEGTADDELDSPWERARL